MKTTHDQPELLLLLLLRELPSIDAVLRTPAARSLRERVGAPRLADYARGVIDEMRRQAIEGAMKNSGGRAPHTPVMSRAELLSEAARKLQQVYEHEHASRLRRVINASGVILHTNLGRAPLAAYARERLAAEAAGYCTLEYDLARGARGRRGGAVEELLAEITGAEAALVVNNCAAAALLTLTAIARDGETIVSRGELVEIGGDFRVPDVMAQSGTRMVEVGTTNRTHLADYRDRLSANTRLIMRVHPSNYRIVGFTAAPASAELVSLAHDAGVLFYEDAGSGALVDFSAYGLDDEPLIGKLIADGVDVVSFSGDKLLGGPQSGLIVGRRSVIERLRREPLYRALRADKLALAALEATLEHYARGDAAQHVPVLRMIALSYTEMQQRIEDFMLRLRARTEDKLSCEIIAGESAIGGGAGAASRLPSPLLALKHQDESCFSAEQVAAALRRARPPVVARIAAERLLIDLRTVAVEEEAELLDALASALAYERA